MPNDLLPNVLPLTSGLCQRPEAVGHKAATLAGLAVAGFNVPPGWCIPASVHVTLRELAYDLEALPNMRQDFTTLMTQSASKTLIVRSSGLLEDSETALFPGLFRSVRNVSTYAELLAAILTCMKSSESEAVGGYCALRGLPASSLKLAVLVQEQVTPGYSGVAFSSSRLVRLASDIPDAVIVELAQGDSAALLAGGPVTGAFTVNKVDRHVSVLNAAADLRISDVESIVTDVAVLAQRIEQHLGQPQDIEWAYREGVIYVLQSRPIPNSRTTSVLGRSATAAQAEASRDILPDESTIGLKGAAMKAFVRLGLFKKPTLFLEPHGSLADFRERLGATDFGGHGITGRYSHGNDIGLPRYFAYNTADMLRWLQDTWNLEWLGIVHSYMDVVRSFELYLAEDHWVMEHVPGVWESDSTVSPDVLISNRGVTQMLRVRESRATKLLSPAGKANVQSEPVSRETLVDWHKRLRAVLPALNSLVADSLPLNVHFVADRDEQWQFLNIRRTKALRGEFLQRGHFHTVTDADDVAAWDGQKALLIAMAVERGQEARIIRIVSALPATVRTVYVAFGVLSHPAIVLREHGIDTIAAYTSHDLFEFTERGDN